MNHLNLSKSLLILIAVIGVGMISHAAMADHCRAHILANVAYSSAGETATTSLDFSVYLGHLLKLNVITIADLRRFEDQLKQGIWTNPINNEVSGATVAHQIHSERLAEYLASGLLNREFVLSKLQVLLSEERESQKNRSEVDLATKSILLGLFYRVEAGDFKYLDWKIHLTHPISVQSTLVTRDMWNKAMGGLPEDHRNHLPDQRWEDPVSNISLLSAMAFANQMSQALGLKPVYNLRYVYFPQASWGRSYFQSNGIVEISGPTIYETEGFRLPTLAEQLYLLSNRGQNWEAPFGLSPQELLGFAWLNKNSVGPFSRPQPQAVGTKKPLRIGTGQFYDLFGNLFWWNSDGNFQFSRYEMELTDPYHMPSLFNQVQIFGMSHNSGGPFDSWTTSVSLGTNDHRDDLGLRLVRTLPQ